MNREMILRAAQTEEPFETVVDGVRYTVVNDENLPTEPILDRLTSGVGHYEWYTYFTETRNLLPWIQTAEADPTASTLSVTEALSLITIRPIVMMRVELTSITEGIENYTITKYPYFLHGPPQ